ncbi:MAG: hypothetical protein JWR51_3859 [Devosia sp.]|uniref:hypothetical protein n=1 Tax=Devosia sp. TaxID=1871048 RepID=UPI00260A8870|nr:hypothetical protein [Devosia sp.]MDB5530756.1 hypothetical protein [Devosia sp.]
MTETAKASIQSHPFMTELESTHGDVLALHPLLQLLEEEGTGEDPIRVIVTLLEAILGRLSQIESALSLPERHSPEPVEL